MTCRRERLSSLCWRRLPGDLGVAAEKRLELALAPADRETASCVASVGGLGAGAREGLVVAGGTAAGTHLRAAGDAVRLIGRAVRTPTDDRGADVRAGRAGRGWRPRGRRRRFLPAKLDALAVDI